MNNPLFVFYNEEENKVLLMYDFIDHQTVRDFINALIASQRLRKIMAEYATRMGSYFELNLGQSVVDFIRNDLRGTKFIYYSDGDTWEISGNNIVVAQ